MKQKLFIMMGIFFLIPTCALALGIKKENSVRRRQFVCNGALAAHINTVKSEQKRIGNKTQVGVDRCPGCRFINKGRIQAIRSGVIPAGSSQRVGQDVR